MRVFPWLIFSLLFVATAHAQQPPAKVATAGVFEKELAQTRPMVGVIDFNKVAGLSPEISGLIDTQFIHEGAVVNKGTDLVRLNTDFIHKDIALINQEIRKIGITIKKTGKNRQRLETLFSEKVASEREFDDLDFSLKELMAQQESLRVKLAKKELELAKSTLRAPFNGLVLARFKAEGEWISPGVPVCLLGAIDDVVVRVAVDEKLAAFIRPGQQLSLSLPPLNKPLTGELINRVPVADTKTKTFRINIAIPYFKGLIQNMSARVEVPVSAKTRLKMIRRDALVRHEGKTFIYTVKEGKAKILPIHIVAADGEYLGVDNTYIKTGMPVVVDGNERLRPGQAVTVIKSE